MLSCDAIGELIGGGIDGVPLIFGGGKSTTGGIPVDRICGGGMFWTGGIPVDRICGGGMFCTGGGTPPDVSCDDCEMRLSGMIGLSEDGTSAGGGIDVLSVSPL